MGGNTNSQYLETHTIATLRRNASWLENFQSVKGMLGLAFEGFSQINKGVGLCGGEILKKVSPMEGTNLSKGGSLTLNRIGHQKEGGSGLQKALLGKQNWRFASKREFLGNKL